MTEPQHVGEPRAVYDATADAYVRFAGVEISSATESSVDQALFRAFADLTTTDTGGRIADVGCGPGPASASLANLGANVVGFDVTEAMVPVARTAHPAISFEQGHWSTSRTSPRLRVDP